jgi:hypothetical protein
MKTLLKILLGKTAVKKKRNFGSQSSTWMRGQLVRGMKMRQEVISMSGER